MRVFRATLYLMMVSALGCAGSQPVRVQLSPPGARIGILNVLEPQMTHVDVGSLRFDSFTKVYNVDWNIPDYINRTIENDLKSRGNYTFIPIAANAPADWKQSTAAGILSASQRVDAGGSQVLSTTNRRRKPAGCDHLREQLRHGHVAAGRLL